MPPRMAEFAALTFPGHDLPVAWREPDYGGIKVIACPTIETLQPLVVPPEILHLDAIVLPEQPGRKAREEADDGCDVELLP